ncbi:AAA family ATPase [Streptomyces sp. NPDC059534]|uniref:AAA family ATPase n=1 Tax=Streptomyces sp. NPDC059534 TaxID=3346859 RepID=UPI0036A7D525
MQHAVGGPLPSPERPGQAPDPGPVPLPGAAAGPGAGTGGGAQGAPPPVPPAPPQGTPYPGHPSGPPPAPPLPGGALPTPPPPAAPAPAGPAQAGGRLGVHPAVQGGGSRHPQAPAPSPQPVPPHVAPAAPQPGPGGPGWGAPGGIPQGQGASRYPAGPPPRADLTGQVALPPVGVSPVPAVELGGGTGTATLAVLLIGPAGAGKTTVARHWAQRRRVPTAHISLDDVREWVCSGFADPQSGWSEHAEAQYRLARRTCGFAARNYLANGISCIVDDAVFPDRPVVGLGGWKRHVGPGLLPVVLLPGLEVVLERNAERSGNRRLSDEEVAAIHGRMAGWYGSGLPIIDNSTYDVETTARVLDDVLARAIASPPTW